MADPTIQSFCCHNGRYDSDVADRVMTEFNSFSYNIVCLCSSLFGILGGLYQIYPKTQPHPSTNYLSFSKRGRQIIVWLAVADLLASLGVFIRSLVWLKFNNLIDVNRDSSNILFCALSSAWTQYFYTATWLWTLFYAIDVYLALNERDGYATRYHILAWGIPAVTTATGLSILYIPNAECHNLKSLTVALLRVLPNYCVTYIPILIVMVANPIIYYLSSKDLEMAVFRPLSQMTNKERYLAQNIKLKFALINVVFYCCWLPNVVNGLLLWILWFSLPTQVTVGFWYLMALMNPLQALFNAMIYRRWSPAKHYKKFSMRGCCLKGKDSVDSSLYTPLLHKEIPSRLHLSSSSRNNSINLVSST